MGYFGETATAVPGGFTVNSKPGDWAPGSPNFYEDPTVNALAELPSLEEAKRHTGLDPSFHKAQRPGDWQRSVQRQMAAEQLPGGREQLGALIENRVEGAKAQSGNLAPNAFATIRALGADRSLLMEQLAKEASVARRQQGAAARGYDAPALFSDVRRSQRARFG